MQANTLGGTGNQNGGFNGAHGRLAGMKGGFSEAAPGYLTSTTRLRLNRE
jgi:hypothetical protein